MDSRIEITNAEMRHIPALLPRLRDADLVAIALAGQSPRSTLHKCYRASIYRRSAFVGGEIGAMWGCSVSLLGDRAEPWLFTTALIEQFPRSALELGRHEIAMIRERFGRIEGTVCGHDARAIRFGRKIGMVLRRGVGVFLPYEVA